MARQRTLIPLAIAVIGVAIAFFFLTGKPAPQKIEAPELAPLAVDVLNTKVENRSISLLSQGVLRAKQAINWQSEVGGRVTWVSPNFADGAFFAAGEVLLHIDPSNYQTALSRAKARLADAQQLLAQEKGRARQAKREWRDLGDDNANALFLREPQLAAAKAQLEAAQAELRQAQRDLDNTKLKAPFNGRIERTSANIGQVINSNTAVASIYSTDQAELRLPLNERQQSLLNLPLRPGTSIDATVIDQAGKQRKATISRSDAKLDERTRLLYLIAEIDDPLALKSELPALKIGDFVRAEISSAPQAGLISAPRQALRGQDEIWLAVQGRLSVSPVKVLQIQDDSLELQLEDSSLHGKPIQLITTPLTAAKANTPIRIMTDGSADMAEASR